MAICTLFICVIVFMVGCTHYTEYIPIVLIIDRGDHILKEDPSLLSPEHIDAMQAILKKYGENFEVRDGKLLIEQSLQRDKDLLQNYSFKAECYRKNVHEEVVMQKVQASK